MSALEWFAASLGLVAVWLTVREKVAAWPIGAAMVALYVYIFASAKLYADAGLQGVYFVLQFYGWYQWLRGGAAHSALLVSRAPARVVLVCVGLGTAGTAGLGWLLARHTDQALPYWDSGIAAFSLVAQWMLARKLIENWIFWFVIDIVAVGVYASRGLVATTLLYAVYIGLAVSGYRTWRAHLVVACAVEEDMSAIQREAVGLITQQRWAAIGSTYEGQPLVSMIAYAAEPGLGGLLIFVSMMAAHTRALLEDPRCSLAISDPDTGEGDPQLLKRVTLNGRASPIPRDDAAFQAAAERYVGRFPDAAMRFQLGDFVLLRITIDSARYVGGFARASTFSAEQLQGTARELEAAGPRG